MKRGLQRNRSRSARYGSTPEYWFVALFRSPSSLFRIALHGMVCIFGLMVGLRLSREALIVLLSFKQPETSALARTFSRYPRGEGFSENALSLQFPYVSSSGKDLALSFRPPNETVGRISPVPPAGKSNRVHVGRHEILIRQWPHPDPLQTVRAHRLIELVQKEQKRAHAVKQRKPVIVITPTYVRTFQAVHMTCLMYTLRLVPGPLIWIVIEPGGVSNETATLLSSSGLTSFHLSYDGAMPSAWEDQRQAETRLRIEGLRFVRERRLDGIVVFADDSNTHSLDFFNGAQSVKWVGTLSVGLLLHSGGPIDELDAKQGGLQTKKDQKRGTGQSLSIQGPACNLTGHVTGWYAPNFNLVTRRGGADQDLQPLRSLEWAGFMLDAQLLWEGVERPTWIRDWEEWVVNNNFNPMSPLDMVKDAAFVEGLGNCGQDVWLWWLRVEARADSRFPPRWVIDPPLEIVVPSKHTPWPDPPLVYASPPPPPPLSTGAHQSARHRSTRGKRGSRHSDKRKHSDVINQKVAQFPADRTIK